MSAARHAVVALMRGSAAAAAALLGKARARRLMSEALNASIEDTLAIETSNGPLRYAYVNGLTRWRVETLWTKEPETIEWLDTFKVEDVFWDVGANIGLYSLYAAHARGAKVVAFEPASGNYALLNRQILLNRLDDRIKAYSIAVGAEDTVGALQMRMPEIGGSMSSFEIPVDSNGETFEPTFAQGAVSLRVDTMVERFGMAPPTHIKIDVDGLEDLVIAGAAKTLARPGLKSLAIELPTDRPDWTAPIKETIAAAGLVCKWRRHADMFETGEHANLYNHLFVRP